MNEIIKKLDADFFAGRWALVTDRQKDLLRVMAQMPNSNGECTVQEIVTASQNVLKKPFASSRVSAILVSLMDAGLNLQEPARQVSVCRADVYSVHPAPH